jgi:hypothetical protein
MAEGGREWVTKSKNGPKYIGFLMLGFWPGRLVFTREKIPGHEHEAGRAALICSMVDINFILKLTYQT